MTIVCIFVHPFDSIFPFKHSFMISLQPKTRIFGIFLLACFIWQIVVFAGLKQMDVPTNQHQAVKLDTKQGSHAKEAALPLKSVRTASKF
jgi:hypothetical protein